MRPDNKPQTDRPFEDQGTVNCLIALEESASREDVESAWIWLAYWYGAAEAVRLVKVWTKSDGVAVQ